jgi:YaiO family outer membrane protein
VRSSWLHLPAGCAIAAALFTQAPSLEAQTLDPVRSSTASPAAPGRTEARMSLQIESLSNGSGDWHDASFEIAGDAGTRRRWYATAHDVRRFSLHDDLFSGGYLHPLGKNTVVSLEVQGSFSHRVVPQFGVSSRIDAAVGRGWVLNAGLAERRYDTGGVTMLTAGVEKYVGPYRLAYTSYGAFVSGGGVLSHAAAFDRSYGRGEDNVVGVTISAGEELEQDVRAELRTSQVRGISARGRHWFGRRIGIIYTVGVHEQGTHYTRRGGTLGIAFRF